MDWVHILDRKHFTDQISTNWTNLSDPDAFRVSITEILDSTSISIYTSLTRSPKDDANAPLVYVRMTVVDSSLSRNANYMGVNFANQLRKRKPMRKTKKRYQMGM